MASLSLVLDGSSIGLGERQIRKTATGISKLATETFAFRQHYMVPAVCAQSRNSSDESLDLMEVCASSSQQSHHDVADKVEGIDSSGMNSKFCVANGI